MKKTTKNNTYATTSWGTDSGNSPMVHLAQHFHPISKEAVDFINTHSSRVHIAKGDYLVKKGQACDYIYFVEKGILRAHITEGKKEITTWITSENEMITSIRGFILREPAVENIQAIEDSSLIAAHVDDLEWMYENCPELNIVGRKLYQQYYIDAEERAYISRLTNAASKYNRFVDTRGALLNRIPLKYVASYLNMTLETLSRMRSKMGQANKKKSVETSFS